MVHRILGWISPYAKGFIESLITDTTWVSRVLLLRGIKNIRKSRADFLKRVLRSMMKRKGNSDNSEGQLIKLKGKQGSARLFQIIQTDDSGGTAKPETAPGANPLLVSS